MTLATLLAHTATIVTPGVTVDRYGPTPDWTNAAETTTRAWFSQRSALEDRDHREAQIGDWVGFFPAGTILTGHDRVRWGSITFEVDGPPNPAGTPRGAHHVEARLRVVDG